MKKAEVKHRMFFDLNRRAASFYYNGDFVELIPARMTRKGKNYEKTLPDGLTAILEIDDPAENARYQLLRFENRGSADSGEISRARSLDLVLPADGVAVWESLKGDSCGSESFNPLKKSFAVGDTLRVEPRGGRPSDTCAFPFFDLSLDGRAATFGVGWSGQWVLELERTQSQFRAQAGLAAAQTYLCPGEAFRAASVLWLAGDSVPETRRAFRRLMFERFSPHTADGAPVTMPVAETSFDRYFGKRADWATVEGQKRCADIAARCHMDTLWLDAAWFKDGFPVGVGNYSFGPGFPDGLSAVGEYAHAKGLRFVQWFEPERVNCYSETYRDHADEVIVPKNKNTVDCLLDIGRDEVRRRVTDILKKMIREHRLDVYRQDFNMSPSGYWDAEDAKHPGRRGMTEIRFVEGHYKMWDEIQSEFPGVVIDNCASGGRRIDLETCRRAVVLWRSDTGCSPVTPDRPGDVWSQNHILALTRYLPYHASGSWTAAPYDVRSVFSGGIVMNLDVFSPDFDAEAVIPAVDECERLREYWYGDFYPLTEPDNAADIWASWQFSLGDRGVIYAFRRGECPDAEFAPAPQATEPGARYEVRITDERMLTETRVMSGEELQNIRLRCQSPRESVIAEYRKIREL